jgi:hypothetical protein
MSGPKITISAKDRDTLYHRIFIHLSGIDAVWLAARHRDFTAADRLGQEFCDELHLVMDDLGWGESRGDAPVELTSPPEALRRIFERLRRVALEEDGDEEDREVRAVCDRALAALDALPATGAEGV